MNSKPQNINSFEALGIPAGKAICYSGYREGQSPDKQTYPSYEQILEDLLILKEDWKYLRLYDCTLHAERVLELIRKENLDFKVLLGAYIHAELNNFGCPWGGVYAEEELERHKVLNQLEVERLIALANRYSDVVVSLAVGNEATVEWTDHFISVEKLTEYVKLVKKQTLQPVTFCENYVPWHSKLASFVNELDFISIHTYPVWEYKDIHSALAYTQENYYGVQARYPDKPVVITEAGWATNSNGRGIHPENVNQELQAIYVKELLEWTEQEGILAFVFEAFDEPWKGSPEANEPEKHWGLYTVDRKPKLIMQKGNLK